MPNLAPDYTSRDRAAILRRSQKVAATSYPDWSSEETASFGNFILNAVADEGDSHNHAHDNTTRQSRLVTATLRGPVLQHVAFLGYTPKQNSAAITDMLVVLSASPTAPIEIGPDDIFFSTEGSTVVKFRPTSSVTIDAGIEPPQFFLSVENAEMVTDFFVSDNTEGQRFTLRRGPYIQDSAVVSGGGEVYEVRASLLESGPDDAHMRGRLIESDRLQLTSGNGELGKIPQGQVVATYKVGGGRIGIVEANTITAASVSSLKDQAGNSYQIVSVTNPDKTAEGDDRESIASMQERGPRSRNTASARTIGSIDYINHSEAVAGVARTFLVTPRNAPIAPNNLQVIVIPTGGGQPSATLKDRVLTAVTVDNPNNPLSQVEVVGPDYLTVDIQATVHLSQGAVRTVVRQQADAAMEAFFAPQNSNGTTNTQVRFGAEFAEAGQESSLPFHDILTRLQTLPTVFKIDQSESGFLLNLAHADVLVGSLQFPALGTLRLFDASDGTEF